MRYMTFLLALLFVGMAGAQESSSSPRSPSMDLCKGQIQLYCSEEGARKDVREILRCLMKNDDQLSIECKQEIQRFVQAVRQTTPPGGGPLGALGGLAGLSSQIPSVIYEGRVAPSLRENTLNASTPFYKTETDTFAVTLSGGHLHLEESVFLNTGREIPTDLYRAEVGLQYSHKLPGQRMFGVRGSLGATGDKINKSTESFSVSTNYSFPGSKESHWVLMLMMSNNSPFGTLVPIPGFFYIYRTPTFTGVFGMPILSMQWTPLDPWSFSFSAFGPQLKSEVSYGAIDKIQFFTGLSWKQQRFILSERSSDKERLSIEDKNVEMGFRKPLFMGVFSELQTGYSFDRSLYVGEGLFKKDGGDAALAANGYLKWSVRVAF